MLRFLLCNQVKSIDTALAYGARGCEFESRQFQCSRKLSVLEISLVKELTANCLIETCTILKELIPAAMVNHGLTGVQPLVVVAVFC